MRRKGLFQPALLGFLLAGGFLILWLVASTIGFSLIRSFTQPFEPSEYLVFRSDGTALRQVRIDRYQTEYRDLEGHEVLASLVPKSWQSGAHLPAALPGPAAHAPGSWDECIRPFSDGNKPAVFWYFISDGRPQPHGYFVGYDSRSNARIGYLGTAGFRAEALPAEEYVPFSGSADMGGGVIAMQRHIGRVVYPFWIEGGVPPPDQIGQWDVYLLGHDHKVYHANLRQRTLDMILADPELRSLQLSEYGYESTPDHPNPCRLLARTEKAVLVLDARGGLLHRYPTPEPLRAQDFAFLETSKGEGVMYRMDRYTELRPRQDPLLYHIWWVRPEGQVRHAEGELIGGKESVPRLLPGIICPAPLVLALFEGTFLPWVQIRGGEAATYAEGLGQTLQVFYPSLIFAGVVSAALAGLCYRREVRYGGSGAERVVWALFVLALGLPGWLAYRFGRSWPRLERCPTCGAVGPGNREQCAQCTAEFPRPALKGTEVFA